ESEELHTLRQLSAYADDGANGHPQRLRIGEGLIGQCAADKRRMLITDMPKRAVPISSALFKVVPSNIIVLPVLFESQVKAVIELASVNQFTALQTMFLEQLTASIGIVLTRSKPRCRPKACSSNRNSSPLNCRRSNANCSKRTSNLSRKRNSSPSATSKLKERTRKSSRRVAHLKRRQPNSR